MTGGRLRKLFGRAAPVSQSVSEAIEELHRLGENKPFLAQHASVLAEILPVVCGTCAPASVSLDEHQALAKQQKGTPILCGEVVNFDKAEFNSRWQSICRSIERHRRSADPAAAAPAENLAKLLNRPGWSSEALVHEVLAGNLGQTTTRAESEGLADEQLKTVLRFALFPLLSQIRQHVAGRAAQCPWSQGCCPICGSWPLLGELRGLEQDRFLRCGLCAAEWQFPRLQCPFCGTRDHRQLGYLQVELEADKYRVATCARCQGYIKTASTLAALPSPRLFVLDLETMHLDLTALDRGYRNTCE